MFFTVIMYSVKAQLHFHSQVSSIFKDPALFIPAAMAVIFSKIIKHHLKVGIFFEYRRLQQEFKPPGRGLEIAQFFFELDAQLPDIPVDMGETGFTAKPGIPKCVCSMTGSSLIMADSIVQPGSLPA
jgi:hypothetical protein